MDDRDWLLRQLQQLLDFVRKLLARVQKLREAQEPRLALQELGAAYLELFGLEARFLPMMTPDAVRKSLGSKAREGMLAELLLAEAELRGDLGERELADKLLALAAALANEGARSRPER